MHEWLRNKMIDEVFKFGYGSEKDRENQSIRWTRAEMHALATDEDVLSLWIRYVTYWPPQNYSQSKEEVEKEALAQIALTKMLA